MSAPPLDAPAAPAGYEDDPRLVDALRQGDEDAFRWLVRRHDAALQRYARYYLRDRAVAEEVVQETWLGVIRGIGSFEGRSSVRTWIFQIAANRARTRGRQESRSTPFSALVAREADDASPVLDPGRFRPVDAPRWAGHWTAPPPAWNAPEARVLEAETRAVIDRAVAALPPVQREVITLRDVVGLEAVEVCRLMELSEGNQRVLLHRARSRVRAALDAHMRDGGDA